MSENLLRVEFHSHTVYSKDSLTSPEKFLESCRQKGIDRVVITDHNTTAGALHASRIDPQRVIVGEEIMTTKGEILAAFVQEEIPPGLSPEETIRRLRQQGALISVSHPFDIYRAGHWQLGDLQKITPLVDAIEVFNSRCMSASHNRMAAEYAHRHNLAGTVGSDAHTTRELGRSTLLVAPFTDAASFKLALASAEHQTRLSAPWIHFSSRYAVWYKKVFSAVKLKDTNLPQGSDDGKL